MAETHAAKEIHKDSENTVPSKESGPRYDHNFLVSVQTNSAVAAEAISRLLTAFDSEGLAAGATYVGTIDYGE